MAGGQRWKINPRYAVPAGFFYVLRLWRRCQSGMGGYAQLPELGGINAQPAWLMSAFDILAGAEAEARKADDAARNGGAA